MARDTLVELIEHIDTEMMMLALAQRLGRDLRAALQRRERALLVVPGGGTPGPAFDLLCGIDLEWERVDVVLSDERWVPEDHPRSNTRLLRARLLRNRASAARFLPLYADCEHPEQAIATLSAPITAALPVDVALLGMGADMHTASLFPGADRLAEALAPDAPTLVAMRAPGAGEPRITLSAPVLREAFALHIVITGAEKRAALEAAQGADPMHAPVAALLPQAVVHWAP